MQGSVSIHPPDVLGSPVLQQEHHHLDVAMVTGLVQWGPTYRVKVSVLYMYMYESGACNPHVRATTECKSLCVVLLKCISNALGFLQRTLVNTVI